MRDVEPQPQLRRQPAEQVEQAQRVRPARHADDDRLTGGEQAIPLRVLPNGARRSSIGVDHIMRRMKAQSP